MLYSVAMNSVEEERLLEETQVEDLTEEQREQTSSSDAVPASQPTEKRSTKLRNIVGFWLLGFCIDYAYFIMLSAAFDIIHSFEDTPSGWSNATNGSGFDQCMRDVNGSWPGREPCEKESTSLILLADILPLFFMKLTVPFFMNFIPYWIRVLATALFSLLSFLLVGLSFNMGVVILGVVCASISTGFGELTFLSLTSRYKNYSVAALGSGTGFAGVGGTAVYALSKLFLSTSVTLYLQLYIPVVMVIVYFTLLGKPGHILPHESESESESDTQQTVEPELNLQHRVEPESDLESVPELEQDIETFKETESLMTEGHNERGKLKLKFFNKEELAYWWRHVKYVPRLWKYMLPLFVVYMAEYAINQSLFELMYSPGTHMGKICIDQRKQYRGLQIMYTIGVFLSRTSVSVFRVKYYWILSILQVFNFVFFFFAACYLFIPLFWITCLLVLYEGLLGGAVFVNAFYAISKDVPTIHREFSMGVASVADSVGITIAAVISEWGIHSFICRTFVDSELDDF